MPRAYHPRLTTVQTLGDVLAVEGVSDARLLPPTRTGPRNARIRVTYGSLIVVMTIPQARAFAANPKDFGWMWANSGLHGEPTDPRIQI
jgi:hypothetical protein